MRTTMDIDANITGMNFEKSAIEEMINKIISIKIDDNVIFEIDKNIPIKEDNEYGGYRFKLIAKLSNYRREHEYAKNIKFEDTISAIEKIYNVLEWIYNNEVFNIKS